MRLRDNTVVITGGSQGIGYAIAEACAREGAALLLLARTEKDLLMAQQHLSQYSREVYVCPADVSREGDIQKIGKAIRTHLDGHVDALVNAAGIYGPIGPLEETNERDWKKVFEINVFGTVSMCRLIIPLMKKQKFGKIINFIGGGEGAFPRFTAYASSKGAIVRFTESLSAEVNDEGIQVNAIAPGAVNTRLLKDVLDAGARRAGGAFHESSLKQMAEGGISPEKAAALVLFLISSESNGLTGRCLSAVWDHWSDFPKHWEEIRSSDVFTFRRIKPADRGLKI